MSSLLIPCEYGPSNPKQSIIVDECEGSVNLDLGAVTDENCRHIALTPREARAVATALLHFANEAEGNTLL